MNKQRVNMGSELECVAREKHSYAELYVVFAAASVMDIH